MNQEYLHLEPAPDDVPGAVPRVHVWLNWSLSRVVREYVPAPVPGPADVWLYNNLANISEDDEWRRFEQIVERCIAPRSQTDPVFLYAGRISELRPASRELFRRFIREADAPDAPWPPVDRRRVHVVVDGTRAELEALLGEDGTAVKTR